jgi:hypothetical protein
MSIPCELQAMALAAGLAPMLVVCHVVLFRRRGGDAPGHLHLFISFALYAGAWLLCAALLWGTALEASQIIAGESTAGFVCLAYMQVFSQACRGFSLRVLVDVDRCGQLDLGGILREYGGGRGVGWLLEKRIVVLERQGMLVRGPEGSLAVCPKGRRVGVLSLWLKRVFKPAQGG